MRLMNILFIGSSGALSLAPFKRLLATEYSIKAVGIYKPVVFDNKIIALENESLALAANQSEIPVLDLSQSFQNIDDQCKKYSIDIILMSCYSKRLPDEIINLPAKGCFNMHPSLLPHFRGPEPIFWQMKMAEELGVSWHQVVSELDAGSIVSHKKVHLEEGARYSEINLQLAEIGADLMLELLADIEDETLTFTPQDAEAASYYPYPEQHDFTIDLSGSAQTAFNFMCATRVFAYSYLCQFGNHQFLLDEALDYDNNRSLETVEVHGNSLYIPCNEGVLIASYTDKMQD